MWLLIMDKTKFEKMVSRDVNRLMSGRDAKHFPIQLDIPDYQDLLKCDLFTNHMPVIPDTIQEMYDQIRQERE